MRINTILYLIVLFIGFVSCKKETNMRNDLSNPDVVVFEEPNPYFFETPYCTPDSNSIYYNGSQLLFETVTLFSAPGYSIEGTDGYREIIFEFFNNPRKQKYVTKYEASNKNEVRVSGRFGDPFWTHQYYSVENDTIYVDILDSVSNIYSVTFCDLEFKARNLNPLIQTFRTDGNLKTK